MPTAQQIKEIEIEGVGIFEVPADWDDRRIKAHIQSLRAKKPEIFNVTDVPGVGFSTIKPAGAPSPQVGAQKEELGGRIKRFAQEEAPAAVGGTLGALAGGGTPASIPLAAVGTAAGEAAGQLMRRAGLPIGREVETSGEAAGEIALAGTAGAAGEAIGQGLIRIARPVLRRFLATPKTTIPLSEAETGGVALAKFVEGISEKTLPGAVVFRPFRQKQQTTARELAESIAEMVSSKRLTAQEAGEFFVSDVDAALRFFQQTNVKIYAKVNALSKGVMVETKPIKTAIDPILREIESPHLLSKEQTKAAADLLRGVREAPDSLPFQRVREDRSDLLAILRKNKELLGTKSDRLIAILEREIDDALETASAQRPGLLQAFREANNQYAAGIKDLKSTTIRQLLKKDREDVVAAIFKKGSIDDIRIVKRTISPESFQALKSRFLLDTLDEATKGETLFPTVEKLTGLRVESGPILSFKHLQNAFEKIGQDKLDVIFNQTERQALSDFLQAVRQVGGAQEKGFLPSLVAWSANGFILYSAIAGDLAAAGGVTLGLYLSSKLMTSTNGLRLLAKAILTKPGTQQAASLVTRMVALASKESMLEQGKQNHKEKRREYLSRRFGRLLGQ